MVKDHSDSEIGNPLPPHGLLFPISSKGYFICIIPQKGYNIPRSTGWNEKKLNRSTMKDRSDDPSHHERMLLPRNYISLPVQSRMSYFSFQPVINICCGKRRGMCYPVCGMVHVKDSLLLIGNSSQGSGGSGFPL